jgi:hypothetical protein
MGSRIEESGCKSPLCTYPSTLLIVTVACCLVAGTKRYPTDHYASDMQVPRFEAHIHTAFSREIWLVAPMETVLDRCRHKRRSTLLQLTRALLEPLLTSFKSLSARISYLCRCVCVSLTQLKSRCSSLLPSSLLLGLWFLLSGSLMPTFPLPKPRFKIQAPMA